MEEAEWYQNSILKAESETYDGNMLSDEESIDSLVSNKSSRTRASKTIRARKAKKRFSNVSEAQSPQGLRRRGELTL